MEITWLAYKKDQLVQKANKKTNTHRYSIIVLFCSDSHKLLLNGKYTIVTSRYFCFINNGRTATIPMVVNVTKT